MTLVLTIKRARGAAVLLAAASAMAGASRADVSLPALVADNMVLQQSAPIRVFGKADPGESVVVTIQNRRAQTTAGPDGNWLTTLDPLAAGGPFALVVQGKNRIDLKNVLVGEVWVCSGQSNMEWSLRNSFEPEKHIAAAANTRIRLFNVPNTKADAPREAVTATWQECTPETVAGFSAVGYFFGRDLQKARNVPVGLIQSDWGGSPAEAWTPEPVLAADPILKPVIDNYPGAIQRHQQQLADYPAVVEKAKTENKPAPRRPGTPWKPGELFNGMIAPLTKYTIKGALWYQGESNAGRAAQYRTLLPAMIKSWRDAWQIKDFPFLIVQLAPFSAGNVEGTNYAELREAQEHTARTLGGVGTVVITDVGEENDIHPKKKEPVGARLALLARQMVYKEKVVARGPTFKSLKTENNRALVRFDNVGAGLEAREGALSGFTVAGPDGKFVPASATLVGKDTVAVSAPDVLQPAHVRFGFRNFPVVNLWNKDGLPAVPFRTDAPPDDK